MNLLYFMSREAVWNRIWKRQLSCTLTQRNMRIRMHVMHWSDLVLNKLLPAVAISMPKTEIKKSSKIKF